ncbi:MAG TPA: uroporphyrinogen decarboxylase [Actinomycetota bacterium]|nr:uroporphyrinogen decarboxylase [Actinomycetota bacterium]
MKNDLFLRACRGEPTENVPVWFMRQAGRSLPEYREVRERHSILEVCRTPELAAEVTLQPVRRLGVDAAILFSDIVVPLEAMGVALDIAPGVGPVIESPVRTAQDADRLRPLEPEEGVPFVLEAIAALVEQLDVPLIGFAGAPFTLASYLVEGGPSRDHARTKALMLGDPATWHKLMDRLSEAILGYLRAQVRAGAAAIQLFDSWAGALAPRDYEAHVAPAVTRILEGLADLGVPRIHFGVGTGELLELMAATGTDVMGIDWRVPLSKARARLGEERVLQGNLDPALCLAPFEVVREKALEVLDDTGGRRHVFNLGHGVLPATDPETLTRLVDLVHEWRAS